MNLQTKAISLLFLLLAACSAPQTRLLPPMTIKVDTSLKPAQANLPDLAGNPREVARMVGPHGVAMDFVLGELLLATNDTAKLKSFSEKWGGTILETSDKVDGVVISRVKLDPSAAQVDRILIGLNKDVKDLTGGFTTSSNAASQLLAVALEEANRDKITVTPNFVVPFSDITSGVTTEAPSGDSGFGPDAFSWPYMNSGSPQDIGVGKAWQALSRAGKLGNRVPIMILDGGFAAPTSDYPDLRNVVGVWGERNLGSCTAGFPCPWHATGVTTAAMGKIDNSFGAAGPAGPIGRLVAVPFGGDFFQVASVLGRAIGGAFSANIINLSFGFELDLGWDLAPKIACLGLCPSISETIGAFTAGISASGKLVFAASGNDGKDVDNGRDIVEGSTHIPCELPGIICVGGMGHNSAHVDPNSNLGSKSSGGTVDIYGPFFVWVGPDPDNTANTARLDAGTSVATPFVAGVAALVWAADPTLSADQVWTILRTTAHSGGVGTTGNQLRVNAFGAVGSVLGGSAPTVVLNSNDSVQLNREVSVTAVVTDDATSCAPSSCPLTWTPTPSRIVGNTAFFRFGTVGSKSISAQAEDAVGQIGTASKSVSVVNTAPVVSLSQPTASTIIYQNTPTQLLGSATDLNEGADPGPGAIACRWTSSNAGDVSFPRTGCNTTGTFTTTGARTLTLTATDAQGLTASQSVTISVSAPPANLPPTITLGGWPTVNYNSDGFVWDTPFSVSASATDPEGNTPISFTWKATSYMPGSTSTIFASNVVLSGPSTSAGLAWTPNATPSLLGDFSSLGNACYNGQLVSVWLEATDSLGNTRSLSMPTIRVYRCILI